VETHVDFSLFEMQYAVIFTAETFCYGDVLLQETFCYGDVLLQRRFVWRRFVEETFCAETFCMCAVLTALTSYRSKYIFSKRVDR
jgi:hypothetical protein